MTKYSKKCPVCGKVNDFQAVKCKKCGNKIYNDNWAVIVGFCLIVLFVSIFIYAFFFQKNSSGNNSSEPRNYMDNQGNWIAEKEAWELKAKCITCGEKAKKEYSTDEAYFCSEKCKQKWNSRLK